MKEIGVYKNTNAQITMCTQNTDNNVYRKNNVVAKVLSRKRNPNVQFQESSTD